VIRLDVQIPGAASMAVNVAPALLLTAREALAAGVSRERVGLVVLGAHLAPVRVLAAIVARGFVGASPDALEALCAVVRGAEPAGVLALADAVAGAVLAPQRRAEAPAPAAPSTPAKPISADAGKAIIEAALRGA
jgi:hypothetical protein